MRWGELMKILITGASGFVGKKVVSELRKKYDANDIVALSSKTINGMKTVDSNGYLLSEEYMISHGCGDVDTLIHLGAFTPKDSSSIDDISKSTSNINNTISLLESLQNLEKVIFISTLDVYDNTEATISENTNTNPSTMYGWSKLYCEQVIRKYARQRGITYQILRLGHVYGEGEEVYKKVMPVMIRNAIQGKNIQIYGDGNAIRTFIHIEDVSKSIVNSIELNTSEVINVVGSEAVTIRELANMIKKLSGDAIEIEYIPSSIPNRDCIFDNSKLKAFLLKDLLPFRDGLKREYQYMREMLGQ